MPTVLDTAASTKLPIILIVDDDPAVSKFHARIAELEGCAVLIADSAAEGYAVLSQFHDRIALLLLDVAMDGIDGFGFRQLQLDAPRVATIPTVMVSGRELSDGELGYLRPAAALKKPVSIAQLRELILEHVGQQRPHTS
jgi:DNA-binding response OmpR family regulator